MLIFARSHAPVITIFMHTAVFCCYHFNLICLFKGNTLNLYFLWTWRRNWFDTACCANCLQEIDRAAWAISCSQGLANQYLILVDVFRVPAPGEAGGGQELLASTAMLRAHSGRKHRCFPRSRWWLPHAGLGSHGGRCSPQTPWLGSRCPSPQGKGTWRCPTGACTSQASGEGLAARLSINHCRAAFKNAGPRITAAALFSLLSEHGWGQRPQHSLPLQGGSQRASSAGWLWDLQRENKTPRRSPGATEVTKPGWAWGGVHKPAPCVLIQWPLRWLCPWATLTPCHSRLPWALSPSHPVCLLHWLLLVLWRHHWPAGPDCCHQHHHKPPFSLGP